MSVHWLLCRSCAACFYLTLALRGESPDTLDGQNRVALALTLLIPLTVVLCLAHHQPRPRHTHRLSYQL